MNTNLCYS